jgi:hypothetical protein
MKPLNVIRRGLLETSSVQRRARLAAAILAAPLLIGVPAYAAQDMKVYPGTMCQPEKRIDPVTYDSFGGICNTSAGNLGKDVNIRCPVVRDAGANAFLPQKVTVTGRSGHSNKPVSCTLRVMKKNGTDNGSALAAFFVNLPKINMTEGSPASRFLIKTVEGTSPGPQIPDGGPMMMLCTLPKSTLSAQAPGGSSNDVKRVTSCITNYSVIELAE